MSMVTVMLRVALKMMGGGGEYVALAVADADGVTPETAAMGDGAADWLDERVTDSVRTAVALDEEEAPRDSDADAVRVTVRVPDKD